jgi:hypothetical protein
VSLSLGEKRLGIAPESKKWRVTPQGVGLLCYLLFGSGGGEMDMCSITNWLKTSLGGVIVLGAIGSLIAVLLLRSARFLLVTFGIGVQAWKKRQYTQGWTTGFVGGYLQGTKDSTLAVIFVAYLLARLILASFASLFLVVVFYSVVPSSGPALKVTTFVVAALFFIAQRWLYEEYRDIRALYMHHVYPIIMKQFEARKQNRETDQPAIGSSEH